MSTSSPDGTLTNLDLDQALPLTVAFTFDDEIFNSIGVGVLFNRAIAQFAMPFYGDIVFQGWVQVETMSAGIQQVNAWVANGAPSNPFPVSYPQSAWRTEGGSDVAVQNMPLLASWTAVPKGTSVVVGVSVQNGTGGPALLIDQYMGIAYCTKT